LWCELQALQSRLKYLSTHTIKLQMEEEGDKDKLGVGEELGKESTEKLGSDKVEPAATETDLLPPHTPLSVPEGESEIHLLLEPPPPPTPKEMLAPLDITPFIKLVLGSYKQTKKETL
jgi:hypothetical protein